MRRLVATLALVALASPALAISPYQPIKLDAAKPVTPPAELISDATALLENIKKGDGDAIAKGFAPKVMAIDGALDLTFPRRKTVFGPYKTIEEMLVKLAGYIGGDLPIAADGSTANNDAVAIRAEREFIVAALTDGQPWGTDPMVKGGICSYGYRGFDAKALKALGKKIGVEGSSFVYVAQPYKVKKAADDKAEGVATLQPDLLYALDYDTDAPIGWQAVYLPDGTSAFAKTDAAKFDKPYVSGICFGKAKDGHWVVVAQSDTSL